MKTKIDSTTFQELISDSVDHPEPQNFVKVNPALTITIDNQVFKATPVLSDSKTIYDLGNGYWLLVSYGDHMKDDRRVQAECDYYNKMIQCGLRAPSFQKKIVSLEGRQDLISACMIPSFDSMLRQGKQIRFDALTDLSRGHSLIFGSKDNVNDLAHWRAIFKGIKQDIVINLLNNFSFRLKAFNIIIEDTVNTPQKVPDEKARVFSEMHQEMHLYFADFYRLIHRDEGQYCHFIGRDGAILEDEIVTRFNEMRLRIIDGITQVISRDEEKIMTGTSPSYSEIYDLMQASTVLEQAWSEVLAYVLAEIKDRVANMTNGERAKYTVPAPDPEIAKKNQEWLNRQIAESLDKVNHNETQQVAVSAINSQSVTQSHILFSEQRVPRQRKKRDDTASEEITNNNDGSGCAMM
jgi:hypothetical protein